MFIDIQGFGQGGDKFQGVELGLSGALHRTGYGKGQGKLPGKFRRISQLVQCPQLPIYFLPVFSGVDVGIFFLKPTVDVLTQLTILFQRRLLGPEILPGPLHAKPLYQLVVD